MKKNLFILFVFFSFFFFSCFNVNATEYVNLSTDNMSFKVHLQGHYTTTNEKYYINSNHTTAYNPDSSMLVDEFVFNVSSNDVILANHEYDLLIQLGNTSQVCTENDTSHCFSPYPNLFYVGKEYSLDTNMILKNSEFKFYESNSSNVLTRSDLTDSYFYMSYDDSNSEVVYYIYFNFVSPVDINNFQIILYPNINIVDTNQRKIWLGSNNVYFSPQVYFKSFKYNYGEFMGFENPSICIGDECSHSLYLGYTNTLINDTENGGSSLRNIISNAWSGASSFIVSSYYILSMCTSLFNALPSEVKAVLLLTFTIGMVVILWKIFRS